MSRFPSQLISVRCSTAASSLVCLQMLSLGVSSTPARLPSLPPPFPSLSHPPFLYELGGVSHPGLLGERFNCSLSSFFKNAHLRERAVTDPPLLQKKRNKKQPTYSLPRRLGHLQRQPKYTLQIFAPLSPLRAAQYCLPLPCSGLITSSVLFAMLSRYWLNVGRIWG